MPDNSLDELFVEVPDLLAKQIEAATTVKVVDAKVAQAEQALKKALFEGDGEVPWLPKEGLTVDFSEKATSKPKWYNDPITEKQLELLRNVNTRATMSEHRQLWNTANDAVGKTVTDLKKLTKGQASEIITKLKEDGVIR